jgi:hypothetical protein
MNRKTETEMISKRTKPPGQALRAGRAALLAFCPK